MREAAARSPPAAGRPQGVDPVEGGVGVFDPQTDATSQIRLPVQGRAAVECAPEEGNGIEPGRGDAAQGFLQGQIVPEIRENAAACHAKPSRQHAGRRPPTGFDKKTDLFYQEFKKIAIGHTGARLV